jgi:hypothetical protein
MIFVSIDCSTIMFRSEGLRRLGTFLRTEYEYADDLHYRLMPLGDIARFDEQLTICRRQVSRRLPAPRRN